MFCHNAALSAPVKDIGCEAAYAKLLSTIAAFAGIHNSADPFKIHQHIKGKASQPGCIPFASGTLESYPMLTVTEKNQLWKLVLKKATVYRSQDGELTVHIYPKLPK